MRGVAGLLPAEEVQLVVGQQQNLLHAGPLRAVRRGAAETDPELEHGHRAPLQR